jgi:carboxyl-terminal processing protease
VEIDGENTKGWSTWKAAQKLRGKPGTEVTIKIWREGEDDLLTFNFVREVIHIKSVKNAELINDNIGYIRITAFREDTFPLLRESILELQNKGIESLVLDLRNNPGGLLESSIQVSDLFLPKGDLIVYTEGRDNKDERKYYSRSEPFFSLDKKIVILANEGSASASEIVAGALRDNNRAIIIGTKTFGKGAVQSIIELDNDYALRLTTANYYIPRGECIEGTGILPDIEMEISKEEKKQARELLAGYKKEDIQKDPQLRKAVEYLEGKTDVGEQS